MKEYVERHSLIEDTVKKYPILEKFWVETNTSWYFSSELINEYLGKEIIQKYEDLSSESINKVLAILDERGEL